MNVTALYRKSHGAFQAFYQTSERLFNWWKRVGSHLETGAPRANGTRNNRHWFRHILCLIWRNWAGRRPVIADTSIKKKQEKKWKLDESSEKPILKYLFHISKCNGKWKNTLASINSHFKFKFWYAICCVYLMWVFIIIILSSDYKVHRSMFFFAFPFFFCYIRSQCWLRRELDQVLNYRSSSKIGIFS